MTQAPELGSDFAGYRLEQLVARGGMGVVYSATHLSLSRRVALKLLAPELAEDSDFRERFLREARLAAGLEHPNVVPVYDAGEEEGVLYLAMRYLAGGDLRDLLGRQGRLSLESTLSIVEQVASALDAAHELSLVHRDVKPANILFSERRDVAYLSDFGVAKRQSSKGLTQTGSFLGSVDYCAPEQIESAVVDGRADVYALGGVCYHCLTGQPPYVRETEVAVLTAHLRDPPPALSSVRPDLPPGLDGVIVTAMAKYPQVRYETAGAFAKALREAISAPLAADTHSEDLAVSGREPPPPPPSQSPPTTPPPPPPPPGPSPPPGDPATDVLPSAARMAIGSSPPHRRRLLAALLAGALVLIGAVTAAVLVLWGTEEGAQGTSAPTSSLAALVTPRIQTIAERQQAINERLSAREQVAGASGPLQGWANDLSSAIVGTQRFLARASDEDATDPPTRTALSAALSAHLAYARALAAYARQPQDRGVAQTAITRAAAAERAYAKLQRAAPSLPLVPVKRAGHAALLPERTDSAGNRTYASTIDDALIDSARTRRDLGTLIGQVNARSIPYQEAAAAIAAITEQRRSLLAAVSAVAAPSAFTRSATMLRRSLVASIDDDLAIGNWIDAKYAGDAAAERYHWQRQVKLSAEASAAKTAFLREYNARRRTLLNRAPLDVRY